MTNNISQGVHESFALRLNIKKSQLITTVTAAKLRTDNEVIDGFCLLGSIINSKGTGSREIFCRLALSRVAIKFYSQVGI